MEFVIGVAMMFTRVDLSVVLSAVASVTAKVRDSRLDTCAEALVVIPVANLTGQTVRAARSCAVAVKMIAAVEDPELLAPTLKVVDAHVTVVPPANENENRGSVTVIWSLMANAVLSTNVRTTSEGAAVTGFATKISLVTKYGVMACGT